MEISLNEEKGRRMNVKLNVKNGGYFGFRNVIVANWSHKTTRQKKKWNVKVTTISFIILGFKSMFPHFFVKNYLKLFNFGFAK